MSKAPVHLVDAIYITADGIPFLGKCQAPAGSFASLRWEYPDETIVVEYVFFGHYRNRVIFHEIKIEEKSDYQ